MLRSLIPRSFLPPKRQPSIPTDTLPCARSPSILLSSRCCPSHPSSTLSTHHPFDELSERTITTFRTLSLLRHSPASIQTVASAQCLSFKTGVLSDVSACTSLVTAYAKARSPGSSLALFYDAAARDIISWNAVISALVLNSCFEDSLVLFQEMVRGFGAFNSTTLVILLPALSRIGDLRNGEVLHGMVVKRRFDLDVYLCNALIDMYAKCGELCLSESVFEEMEMKDAASWNSMISGCLFNGLADRTAFFFRMMRCSDVQVDQVSLSCVISACSCLEELFGLGESVHGLVIKLGCEGVHHSSVANSLISFYSRCGDVDAAKEVFQGLNCGENVVSWNSMICGLAESERYDEALDLFRLMQSRVAGGPDGVTVLAVTQVCGNCDLLREAKSIHGFAIRRELDQMDLSIPNNFLDMYLKCDDLASADLLFETMPNRDLVSWNTMIYGYSCNDSLREHARDLFCEMLQNRFRCSLATLLAILPACTCPDDLEFGKVVHCWQLKCGFITVMSAVNALMLMYINCGDLFSSSLLLRSILAVSDIVSWNTVIVGCVHNGCYRDALKAFKFMQHTLHLHPNPITFVNTLAACGSLGLLSDGKFMHGLALKFSTGQNLQVKNALLTMYFRCGDTESAESVFQTDSNRNLCSWNCMISGLTQGQEGRRAIEYFRRMSRFRPNQFSLVGLLCACTQLGNLRHGREINGYIFRFKLQNNVFISSALLDMYSKLGRLDIAVRIFENMVEKSVVSWNSMIAAYGIHGHGRRAIELLSEMTESGFKATKSTLIALLSACSHSGLVDEGWKHYSCMSEEFGVQPSVEHHVCMVDMLGRAGMLTEACEFVTKVLVKQEPSVWGALLSACNSPTDLKIGTSVAEYLFSLDPENTGYYVTLSNLFASSGMWTAVAEVRNIFHDRGLMKPAGSSFLDVLIK